MEFLTKYYGIIIMLLVAIALIYRSRKQLRLTRKAMQQPFSDAWRSILNRDVKFYVRLDAEDKARFEKRVQRFLATKKITAVKNSEVDDEVRLLVASSAIIPMFAFPEFNYPNVREVLIYPDSFGPDFQIRDKKGKRGAISGMVGNRHLNGAVVLSKPHLIRGFKDNTWKNVGIHEFLHKIDMTDGATDGLPEILMEHSYAAPWLKVAKEEMDKIEDGKSGINPYALTNEAEFLAVASEYFFDKPQKLEKEHPELYKKLAEIFRTGE